MKKRWMVYGLALLVMVLCLMASSSRAFIVVNWQTSGPWLKFGTTWTGDEGDIVDAGSLIQLIWSADGVMDYPHGDSEVTGDDVLLDSHSMQVSPDNTGGLTGARYDAGTYGMHDATFHAGHVYVRAFDVAAPALNVAHAYLQGAWVETLNASPGSSLEYNDADLIPGVPRAADSLCLSCVPEPGSLALFGVGLVVLAARRRFRSVGLGRRRRQCDS